MGQTTKKRLKQTLKNKLQGQPERVKKEVRHWFRKNLPWEVMARPEQRPPEDFFIWFIRAGRGWGKTRTACEWLHSKAMEKKRRMAIAGKTPGDVRDDVIYGEGGIFNCRPGFNVDQVEHNKSEKTLLWPNGTKADIYSGYNPEEPRGFSGDVFFLDEMAAWEYPEETYNNLMFGVREGVNIEGVIATTPKPLSVLQDIEEEEGTVVTTGSSYDNRANLSEKYYENTIAKYEGTSLGDQEIHGDYLDTYGLWSRDMIYQAVNYEAECLPVEEMNYIVVAIDPAVSDEEDSDETGIVVVGKSNMEQPDPEDGPQQYPDYFYGERFWILDDCSLKGTPEDWADEATQAYEDWEADKIIAETNQGGDLVESVIRRSETFVPFDEVKATRGKRVRAQPVSLAYERREVFHRTGFERLQDQMVEFTGEDKRESPDRADALVWGVTYLQEGISASGFY